MVHPTSMHVIDMIILVHVGHIGQVVAHNLEKIFYGWNKYGSSNDRNDGGSGKRVSGCSHHSADSSDNSDIR